jgi:S-adenosyl methyltransferase
MTINRAGWRSSTPIIPRSREQVVRFFDGLELLEPGVVTIDQWPGPAQADSADPGGLATYWGIGMKG